MYKLTEKEYNEKKKKYKETFIHKKNQKNKYIIIIALIISIYILFNGTMLFYYNIINSNVKPVFFEHHEELYSFMVEIASIFFTIGLVSTIISIISLILVNVSDYNLFKEFIEKK